MHRPTDGLWCVERNDSKEDAAEEAQKRRADRDRDGPKHADQDDVHEAGNDCEIKSHVFVLSSIEPQGIRTLRSSQLMPRPVA